MTEPGEIVAPVRIDDRHRRRQVFVGLMMVDDDDVHAAGARFVKRLDAGGAAIDGDKEGRAALGQRAHRLDIRAVAFKQPVGNMDQRLDAAMAQIPRQQRRGGSTVDVVIAEDRGCLTAHDGIGKPRRRFLHAGEHVRIGHRPSDRRIEKGIDRVDLDIAAGKDARQQFGQVVTLRDRQCPRGGTLIEPVAPSAAGRGAFNAEEQAILRTWKRS